MRAAASRRPSTRGDRGSQGQVEDTPAPAPAPNPLGPLGDVMMETVPLQSTDKKVGGEVYLVRRAHVLMKTVSVLMRESARADDDG